MRSRYSAYAKRLNEYVLETWHPDTRPVELGDDAHTRWSGLEITDVVDGLPGDDAGIVQFIARYQQQREQHQLAERSRFVFVEGRWLYVSGDILD